MSEAAEKAWEALYRLDGAARHSSLFPSEVDELVKVVDAEITERDRLAEKNGNLKAQVEAAMDALRLVLPMAKGYAHKNPVGKNGDYCLWAEAIAEGLSDVTSPIAAENERLREALESIHSWLVCYPIATPADMAESFEHMEEVARKALSPEASQ